MAKPVWVLEQFVPDVTYAQTTEVAVAEVVGEIVTKQDPTAALPVITIAAVAAVTAIVPCGAVGAVPAASPKPTTVFSFTSVSQDASTPPWVCRHSDIANFTVSADATLVDHLALVV